MACSFALSYRATMRHRPLSLSVLTTIVVVVIMIMPSAAGASDVDLGSPATIDELLDSPEYIEDEHGDVARLYQAFLARTPDVGGLVYWIDVYEDGATMTDLAWSFAASTEFTTAYGSSLTNARFLEIVYVNVLGRGYDQAGFDYWLGQMAGGLSRPETVLWIVAGDEFRVNYPFAATFPDVTSARMRFEELPDYIRGLPAAEIESGEGRFTITETELAALPQCVRTRVLHSNTFQSYIGHTGGWMAAIQDIYAFSDTAAAEAAVENQRRLFDICSSVSAADSGGNPRLETCFDDSLGAGGPPIGDEMLIINCKWEYESGVGYGFMLYVVRNGNVVTVTDITRLGQHPGHGDGLPTARATSDRIVTLLDR